MITLTNGQRDVLMTLAEYGPLPDHALVPLAQHVVSAHQSSSSIRSRRAELARAGLVVDTGRYKRMPSGRHAKVWGVTDEARLLVGDTSGV